MIRLGENEELCDKNEKNSTKEKEDIKISTPAIA
jgi:hypothetical protein